MAPTHGPAPPEGKLAAEAQAPRRTLCGRAGAKGRAGEAEGGRAEARPERRAATSRGGASGAGDPRGHGALSTHAGAVMGLKSLALPRADLHARASSENRF